MHETCPLSKGQRIHGQYVVGRHDLIQPGFQFVRFGLVLLSCHFDSSLYFGNVDCRHEELLRGYVGKPVKYGAVRARQSQFRDYVSIQ